MAIISKLSLAAGGGVVSEASQCIQKQNQISILIGIGGTGIDALRSIKSQVNERLLPDVDGSYKRIKFLGIDTDQRTFKSGNEMALSKVEYKDIHMSGDDGAGLFVPEARRDLNWLTTNDALRTVITKGDGAGGIRQAGRFLLFDKAKEIKEKIHDMITTANVGIDNPRIVVHIFAGMSGGTGAGLFLDICYFVQKELGNDDKCHVLGYFFMPDINLSAKGIDNATKEYIPYNAYATLQDLNYCMNIPENGGAFVQPTNNGEIIKWDRPPVDMCHLIGAETEANKTPINDKYSYAMHTVTEYVMDFLTENPNQKFDAHQLASNQIKRISTANKAKKAGYNPCVVSIGAACASIPYREINTYLVSGLFDYYRMNHSTKVNASDARGIISEAWIVDRNSNKKFVDQVYASLLFKLSGNSDTGTKGYSYYSDIDGGNKPWLNVLESADTHGRNALETHYAKQFMEHTATLKANADKLISVSADGTYNAGSLMKLLDDVLKDVLCDVNRGPSYVKAVFDEVEGVNIYNLISGLKTLNRTKRAEEQSKSEDYENQYEYYKNEFLGSGTGLLSGIKKKYEAYEDWEAQYSEHVERTGGVYKGDPDSRHIKGVFDLIDDVLDTLEKQVKDRVANFYGPLSAVVEDLTNTFMSNRDALNKVNKENNDSFEMKLITIDEVKDTLENQIKNVSMPDVFSNLVSTLIDAGSKVWAQPETLLSKCVNDFFVGPTGVFRDIASISIDAFLSEKYNLSGSLLEKKINEDWVDKLIANSTPLLRLNSYKYDGQHNYIRRCAYPQTSVVLKGAFGSSECSLDDTWQLNPSVITDRILFVQMRDGFPIQACAYISEIEEKNFASVPEIGRHLYEKDGIYEDVVFSDWRKLPEITCLSRSKNDNLSENHNRVEKLFKEAQENGLIDKSNFDSSSGMAGSCFLSVVDKAYDEAIDKLENQIAEVAGSSALISEKNRLLYELSSEIDKWLNGDRQKVVTSDFNLMSTACDVECFKTVVLDNFYNSPVYQLKIETELKHLERNTEKLNELKKSIEQQRSEISTLELTYKNKFFLAVYTGIIAQGNDGSIVCQYDNDGMDDVIILSAYGKDMPYEEIPFYQAYVTYLNQSSTFIDSVHKAASGIRASDEAYEYSKQLKETKITKDKTNSLRNKCKQLYPDSSNEIERFLVDLLNYSLA